MLIQIILLLLSSILFLFALIKRNKGSRLPPGPIPWPILGNIVEMKIADPKYPQKALAKMADKYGPIMSLRYGVHQAVVLSSYEAMKDVLKRNESNLYRFEFPYVPDRSFGKNLGIIWSSGEVWREVRRYTSKTLKEFGYGKAQSMNQALKETANDLINSMSEEISSNDGVYLVNSPKLSVHLLNLLWFFVGNYKFDPKDRKLLRNMEASDKVMEIIGHSTVYSPFPFLGDWFPNWSGHNVDLGAHKETQEYIKLLIDDARSKRKERLDLQPTSFIEKFLDDIDKNSGNPDTIFTEEQLIMVLVDLFLGGSSTTGAGVNWSIFYMALNPEIQSQFRQEVKSQTANTGETLSAKDLQQIPFVKATILEILRIGNLGPIPPARCATTDIEVDNYVIPKGSAIFMNLEAIFHNKKYWNDPYVFNPKRFLDTPGKTIDKAITDKIAVFGFGNRVCFGEMMAWDSLFVFINALISHFQIDVIPEKIPTSDDPAPSIINAPNPYYVKLTPI